MKRISAILVCIAMLCTMVLTPVYAENAQSTDVKVESVVFSDGADQPITKLPADGTVGVTANLRNLSDSAAADVIMLACVYENDILTQQSAAVSQQIASGQTAEFSTELANVPADGEISVFFWGGDGQIVPLARPAVFPSGNTNIWKLMVGGTQVEVQGNEATFKTEPDVIPQADFYMENSATKVECLSPAASVPGDAQYRFTAPDGTTADFTLHYILKPEYEIYATEIKVNGTALTSFDKNRLEYDAQVEYGTVSATVEVAAQSGVTVSYAPAQTINPTEVDTVTATLTSSNGKVSKEYKVHVRPITIESSDARKAYMNGNHDTGDNKIVLSEVLIGDTQEYTYTSNGKEYTGLLGGNVYTTRLSGDVMTRFGATGENLIGMSHILVSHRDSNKQAQKDYPDTYKQSGNAGAYMYKSKSDHFYFTAGVSGTMYIYTVGAGGARFDNWSKKTLDSTVPEGYDSWADVPADMVLTGSQSDMMVHNEYLVASAINCKPYTNVYIQSFKAGDRVSVPTIGQDSYESVKVLIKWDEVGPAKSSNANLTSLGYKVNGGEVNALTVQDSQTVTVPNDTETVELSFAAEDGKAQGAVQNPAGAVSIGDKPVTITVTVTAEDGSTKSYTVTFEKEAVAAMPDATGISVNGTALTSFHKDRLEYDAQ
ncbi:hypothetical protein INF28_12565, partial [Oscillospiraceae bacterium DSM 107454]|nr:hypothetical protein [Ructibacterium gallinarum]